MAYRSTERARAIITTERIHFALAMLCNFVIILRQEANLLRFVRLIHNDLDKSCWISDGHATESLCCVFTGT